MNAIAAAAGHHGRIGLIVLAILVPGALGSGAVRLYDRTRLNRSRQASGRQPS